MPKDGGTAPRKYRSTLRLSLSGGWLVVEEGLHSARLHRVRSTFKDAGILHREEATATGHRVLVPDSSENVRALARGEELVRAYEAVRLAAQEEGITIRDYKPLERTVLLVAARAAGQSAAEDSLEERLTSLLHEFVWAQPLPNANHRSALLLVAKTARASGTSGPDAGVMMEIGNEFARASKPLIAEKEFLPNVREEKARHLELARLAVRRILDASQS